MADSIEKAVFAEDIFGEIPAASEKDRLRLLKSRFRSLVRKVHPDCWGADAVHTQIAAAAFSRLGEFYADAQSKMKAGDYGKRTRSSVRSASEIIIGGKYIRYAELVAGDIADLHQAYALVGSKRMETVLKLARAARDNEFLEAERDHLVQLREKLMNRPAGPSVWVQCIPEVLDSFLLADSGKKQLRMNVLERFTGFYSVEQIRGANPNGVDGRTVAWMWKRLVLMLDWSHKLGFLHGAVLPPHVMFYPDNDGGPGRDPRKHSIRLIDWCYSRPLTGRVSLKAWSPAYESFYPPEVKAKTPLTAQTDLFMGAKTMIYLAGGDAASNRIPSGIPQPIADSLLACVHPESRMRPQDLLRYLDQFTDILKGVYGPPKYHPFNMPAIR